MCILLGSSFYLGNQESLPLFRDPLFHDLCLVLGARCPLSHARSFGWIEFVPWNQQLPLERERQARVAVRTTRQGRHKPRCLPEARRSWDARSSHEGSSEKILSFSSLSLLRDLARPSEEYPWLLCLLKGVYPSPLAGGKKTSLLFLWPYLCAYDDVAEDFQ